MLGEKKKKPAIEVGINLGGVLESMEVVIYSNKTE